MNFRTLPVSARRLYCFALCWSLFATPLACSGEATLGDSGGSGNAEASNATKAPDPSSGAAPIESAKAETDPANSPYTVQCGQVNDAGEKYCLVDKKTYIGWRTFHAFCHVCHAQNAVGSTFAPSLVDRLQDIDKARFLDTVANGYTGQIGVMPGWDENPNVRKRYEELYAYLKARADGALPQGRPKKIPGSK